MPQASFVPVNIYGSMTAYDPESKDRNKQTILRNPAQKRELVLKLVSKYIGQQVQLINVRTGVLWTVEFEDVSDPTMATRGRVWAHHMLFGDCRLATKEDIELATLKENQEKARITKMEVEKFSTAAGSWVKDMTGAAKIIADAGAAEKELAKAKR